MRILQLRAARGWTLEQTAEIFLVDELTLRHWMRRLDEQGERALVQTTEPVNKYPDFVRLLVRQLKVLVPTFGNVRIAHVLARVGLHLSATTVRRIVSEKVPPPEDLDEVVVNRRRVIAKHPGHTWHVDLTTVPTRAGFWISWFPFSLPQRWPFCWWVAAAVDQFSRALVGFAVFKQSPTSAEMQQFLDRVARAAGGRPKYIITDKGPQFWCRSYKRWCRRRSIRPRYGAVGQRSSIAIVERFIRSMKQECTRRILVPMTLRGLRRELSTYSTWYNGERPHMALAGRTPLEVYEGRSPRTKRRVDPLSRWPNRRGHEPHGATPRLIVSYVQGRTHLPVVSLRRAA
jgi:putative transposase